MYRIELKPGEENVFRTIEELATGIRNGLITPKARIFHQASQKWLPIEFHPHYKKALHMPATKSGETPAVGGKPSTASVTKSAPAAEPKPAPRVAAKSESPVAMKSEHAPVRAPAHDPAPVQMHKSSFAPLPEPKPVPVEAPVAAPVAEPAPTPAPKPAPPLPPVAVYSPVLDLPTINYDEPIVLEAPSPVAHPPITRSARRRLRPLHLGAAAAVLIIGSYVALSAAAPSRETASDAPATAEQSPADSVGPSQVASAPTNDSMPAPTVVTSTSGPSFGARVTPPTAAERPIVTTSAAIPATPARKDTVAIEPAPAAVDLSVPSLPSGDSLAPTTLSDTGAIRRILRAVGGKDAPAPRN